MIRSNTLINYAFYSLVFLCFLIIYTVDGINSDFKVLFTNLLIGLVSLFFMFNGDRYNFSLNKMFMLFSFFFFAIAPALQYQYGVVLWSGPSFSDEDYYYLNVVILCILFIYQGLYHLFRKLQASKFETTVVKILNEKRKLIGNRLLILSLISLVITLYFYNFNLTNLLFRAGDTGRVAVNQTISLIFANFLLPIPVICLVFFKKYELNNRLLEFSLLAIVLISNFPTSKARFYIAAMYIPLLILYFKQLNKKYMLLNKILIFGFLIVFPFLDQARKYNNFSDFKFSLDFHMFLQGHFDSFQMFMRAIDSNIITYGQQLLTAIFFFVPRAIWPEKSIGSGYLVSHNVGLSFDNISMNYFGEGYVNFGYLGILIFTLILAFVTAKLDKMYWLKLEKNSSLSVFYLFLLGLLFFILRGDLLSSFAYTMGICASVFFVHTIALKKSKE
ncbi:oligosaccharide repeat unit polymerase [Aquibacillus koreensis]|uniref:Oligosaccharide repeat unit polymerase n=1 Tax=Aquibacillus koreensis TaxID=279446 RepID=A0A9X3WM13_9BACI|nr:O-antigen polymerase [Aquibacillus koreensis]MDC3419819.1 oligosaccharide repeat unit polymerase [Aquibacillus koreensis]